MEASEWFQHIITENLFRAVLKLLAVLITLEQVGQDTQEYMVEECVWPVRLQRGMGASMETVSDPRTNDEERVVSHDRLPS